MRLASIEAGQVCRGKVAGCGGSAGGM